MKLINRDILRRGRRYAFDVGERIRISQGAYTRCSILVCGEQLGIAQSQVHPLLDWVHDHRVGWVQRKNANSSILWRKTKPQIAFLQSYWDTPYSELYSLIALIRTESPTTKICYLDWFAPAHIPEPRLFDLVDLYIKKNVLRDRRRYLEGMCDTNLIEYEAQWDRSFLNPRQGILTEQQLSKLEVGWSFATDRRLVKSLFSNISSNKIRPIDLHCRISGNDEKTWYYHMRRRCIVAVQQLAESVDQCEQVIYSTARLNWPNYMRELSQSKACLSPFGYGEVCWRDFEAIAAGATLVKPRMEHLEVLPDIYVCDESYLDIDWSFSDLREKFEYLHDDKMRRKLADNASERWRKFVSTGWNDIWDATLQRLYETA